MENVARAFGVVKAIVLSKFPELESVSWRACAEADKEHTAGYRQYAHVGHAPGFVCFAHAADRLEDGNLYGLALHEFGHIIARDITGSGGDPEADADVTVLEEFGIEIAYDGGQSTVEYVDPAVVEKEKP